MPSYHSRKNSLELWKWRPYKVRLLVSSSIYAKNDRNGPLSANQVISTGKPRRSHVVCTLWVHPPTSSYLTLHFPSQPPDKHIKIFTIKTKLKTCSKTIIIVSAFVCKLKASRTVADHTRLGMHLLHSYPSPFTTYAQLTYSGIGFWRLRHTRSQPSCGRRERWRAHHTRELVVLTASRFPKSR